MGKKKTYSEKLQDPRWQKKRLEILDRDEFKCVLCSDKETTLHVHHKVYNKGNDPWEYPNTALITLCKNCHSREHLHKDRLLTNIHRHLEESDLTYSDIIGFLIAFEMKKGVKTTIRADLQRVYRTMNAIEEEE